MTQTDKVILWCIDFSIIIFFLYYAVMRIKFHGIFDKCYIVDISKFILEYNNSKIESYRKQKRYFILLLFKLIDLLLSPYLFILKLLDFFAYIILWIIKWIFDFW